MAELILIRHGETEWSRDGRHTGRTDIPLTRRGEAQARALAPVLARRRVAATLGSPAARAMRTAALAGLTGVRPDPDLWEWDYGGYEGITTRRIRRERPDWYLWRDGVPPGGAGHPGESVDQVGERMDAVLERVRGRLDGGAEADAGGTRVRDTDRAGGDVVLVAHGHALRVFVARWLGLRPAAGALFTLATGTYTVLGTEHARPVLKALNVPPPGPDDDVTARRTS